jgi:rhodanese-related sulfurtransferase
LATKRLNELGYKNAILLKDGLSAWEKADYPVGKGKSWFDF